MSASHSCYKCQADVLSDMSACPSCGAPQTKEAFRAFKAEQRASEVSQRWRLATIVIGVLLFGLGGGLGFWLGSAQSTNAASSSAATRQTSPRTAVEEIRGMNREQINDAFKQYINQKLHLNIVDWEENPQKGLVLEMARPNQTEQPVVWEALTPQERREMIGYLGIVYTSLLQAEDPDFDLEEQGHPVITLQYEGIERRLAVRDRTGQRRVFHSPFRGQ